MLAKANILFYITGPASDLIGIRRGSSGQPDHLASMSGYPFSFDHESVKADIQVRTGK
jgi:hypothetical protein